MREVLNKRCVSRQGPDFESHVETKIVETRLCICLYCLLADRYSPHHNYCLEHLGYRTNRIHSLLASFFSVDFSYLSAAALGVKQTSVFWGIFSVDFSQRVSRTKKAASYCPITSEKGTRISSGLPCSAVM